MKNACIIGILFTFFSVLISGPAFAGDEDIVLVGHQDITDSLTKEEVKQIFLGRKTRWTDDTKITFVIFNDKEIYETFLKTYVRKTPFQYKNYWKKQVFTGKGRMPKFFKHSEDLINFLSQTEGAISFARLQDIDTNVVKIIPVE